MRERLKQPSSTALRRMLIVPMLAVGLTSFIVIRTQQGQGAPVLTDQQVQKLTLASVDRVVGSAPDPIGNEKASLVRCLPYGAPPLRNPWLCALRYPSGRIIEYTVHINNNGSYYGDHQLVVAPPPQYPSPGIIKGCCIPVP